MFLAVKTEYQKNNYKIYKKKKIIRKENKKYYKCIVKKFNTKYIKIY